MSTSKEEAAIRSTEYWRSKHNRRVVENNEAMTVIARFLGYPDDGEATGDHTLKTLVNELIESHRIAERKQEDMA